MTAVHPEPTPGAGTKRQILSTLPLLFSILSVDRSRSAPRGPTARYGKSLVGLTGSRQVVKREPGSRVGGCWGLLPTGWAQEPLHGRSRVDLLASAAGVFGGGGSEL